MIAWAVLLLALVLVGVVLFMSSSSSQGAGVVKPSLGRALVGANIGGTPSSVAEGFSSSSATVVV